MLQLTILTLTKPNVFMFVFKVAEWPGMEQHIKCSFLMDPTLYHCLVTHSGTFVVVQVWFGFNLLKYES